LLLGVAACSNESTAPRPFDVSLESNVTTVTRGDSVTFTVIARGGSLLGVLMDYGDGRNDQYATGGARTARVTFRHAFDAAGTYTVSAAVTDAVAGQKDAALQIRVN
jgi:hypothetical protein